MTEKSLDSLISSEENGTRKNKPESEPLKPFTLEGTISICYSSDDNSGNIKLLKYNFYLLVLKLIKESQQQHGLRHGDYQRYRGYCSRRISRLRKVLKIPQGDRRHFKKRDVSENHINNPK